MTVKLGIEDRVAPFLHQNAKPFLQQNDETMPSLRFRTMWRGWDGTASHLATPLKADRSRLVPARGLVIGLVAGVLLWGGIFVLAWMWFR